jgi:isochorismate synthase
MQTSASVVLEQNTETEISNFIFGHAVENGLSAALWRLPDDPAKHLIVGKGNKTPKGTSLEELPPGFIFAPFDTHKENIFLKAELTFSFLHGRLQRAEDPLTTSSLTWLSNALKKNTSIIQKTKLYKKQDKKSSASTDKISYQHLVSQCVEEIERGRFEKIVPSRFRNIELDEEFQAVSVFEDLCKLYPNALVSLVTSPDTGTWIGATPELLVSVEDKAIFKTVALAATLPYHEGINLKSVAWTQKEIEEQALVERYVISCFKKIRLREYEEHGPKTVVAGNLIHLKSDFTVDMNATNFPQLGSVMLELLHPTSAVCGMPLETSIEFLKANEGYDREFYSGYLGPVNFKNNINIFVNLRCLQLTERGVVVYAGAGVTSDSDPEKEYEETEMKINSLLRIINKA